MWYFFVNDYYGNWLILYLLFINKLKEYILLFVKSCFMICVIYFLCKDWVNFLLKSYLL